MNLGEGQRWGPITYAQHGDDLFIINLFELMEIDKPSYIDIGANHPFAISNTALLYQRGSRGVNIEANPSLIAEFNNSRPGDVNINIGIADGEGAMEFYMFRDGNGLNTFDIGERNLTIASGNPIQEIRMINVITLNQAVDKFCAGKWPHLLSIDIEGLDYDVLRTTDFTDGPYVVCVETRKHASHKMELMMLSHDYILMARLGENMIFVKDDVYDKCRYGF